MLVVSPTSVAAPCRLELTEMAMIIFTGFKSSRFAIAMAMGAIISTVATLSMKALTTPAKRDRMTMAHLTLGTFSTIRSLSRKGILLSMTSATVPMVPAIIRSTLKSTAANARPGEIIPEMTKIAAETSAMMGRRFGSSSIST